MKKEEKKITFLSLSSQDKKKVIKEAARAANKDQRDLLERYNKTFGNLRPVQSCR